VNRAREVALFALIAVEESEAYLNLVLPKRITEAKLSTPDAAFATELAYGTSRNQGFYDFVIEKATGRTLAEIDSDVLCAIRLGVHQLLVLETPAHAAIFETVELVKRKLKQSAGGFANAALRRTSERSFDDWVEVLEAQNYPEEQFLSIRYSHPIWVTRALRLALQSENSADELVEALSSDNSNPKVHLVQLPCKHCDTSDLEPGNASPIGFVLDSGDPSKVDGVASGSLRVQDQGSQLVTMALAECTPKLEHEEWLDLCAGPGGKAVLMAALAAAGRGSLTTNEIAPHRAVLVSTALRHSGLTANQVVGDARDFPGKPDFDRIMLDAPCTGLGALRRRPESRWRKNSANLKELSSLQRELISVAWSLLKPGGVLAYVTCSPHPTETTSQVDWLLRSNANASLLDANATLQKLNPQLELREGRKTAQLWPHRNGTDAMFIALIQKSAD
jgi:16S rRNA (cytosine967-C5)-methyltransferase